MEHFCYVADQFPIVILTADIIHQLLKELTIADPLKLIDSLSNTPANKQQLQQVGPISRSCELALVLINSSCLEETQIFRNIDTKSLSCKPQNVDPSPLQDQAIDTNGASLVFARLTDNGVTVGEPSSN